MQALSCRALARGAALPRRAARCTVCAPQALLRAVAVAAHGGPPDATTSLSGARGVRVAAARSSQQLASVATPERAASAPEGAPSLATTHSTVGDSPFAALGVSPALVQHLASQGLSRPTSIQAAAVPVLLSGKNAAVQGQTGCGKTLAYLLPLLTACHAAEGAALNGTGRRTTDHVLGIVVAPSQELAIQIVRQAEALLGPNGRQYVVQAIGGANMRRQLDALKRNKPMVVVGTPGRLAELSLLGHLRTHHVRTLVLDEADELLDAIFARHLARLQEHAGKAVFAGRQTVLVSATLSQRVLDAYAPWCARPEVVMAAGAAPVAAPRASPSDESTRAGSEAAAVDMAPPPALPKELLHNYVVVDDVRHRVDLLRRSIYALDAQRALVFLNFGRRLADTAEKLRSRGMPVGALHGGLNKTERAATLTAFRAGKLRALLVTDLAARGLDVPECDAVFNLELPSDGVHYAHRAGRTARAGRAGRMVTLAEPRQVFVLRKFERFLSIAIAEAKVYAGEMTDAAEAAAAAASAAEQSR